MGDPKHPEVGDLHIDATDLQIKDITPADIQKLTKVRDGFEVAARNIIKLKEEDADRAGINAKDRDRLAVALARNERLEELHPASAKMTELLYEGLQQTRHEIATLMAEAAAQAKRRADRVPDGGEVLGPLADLMEYQFGPAKKAVATKEKAKEPKDEG